MLHDMLALTNCLMARVLALGPIRTCFAALCRADALCGELCSIVLAGDDRRRHTHASTKKPHNKKIKNKGLLQTGSPASNGR